MDSARAKAPQAFHAGERAIQSRLGVEARLSEVGRLVLRDAMPLQHQLFYAQLPMLFVGAVDSAGRPWASVLVGQPGFVRSLDDRHLQIGALPLAADPLGAGLVTGAALGLLGIELHSRRRNRVSGRVLDLGPQGIKLAVDQTTGNCPQYIQSRQYEWVGEVGGQRTHAVEPLLALDPSARELIARSDTMFVATHAPDDATDGTRGSDVSHRGGRAGFVRVEDERRLLIPDFSGNFFFMTLGNILLNPRAGILFVDFETGDLLTLTGRAEIVWDEETLRHFDGAERAWRLHIEEGRWLRRALPLRWKFGDWSPNSLITGTWDEARQRQRVQRQSQRWRPYRVARKVDESSVVQSFYLEPEDGGVLPPYKPGQHLPIRLTLPDGSTLQRRYTISNAWGEGALRLSVKRDGAASQFLHSSVLVGDRIEALGPRGHFVIDAQARRPGVLIGAGIGITPMIAFAQHVLTEGLRHRHTRPLHLIQVAHDESVRAFGDELHALVQSAHGAFTLHTVLTQEGGAGTEPGRLTAQRISQWVPLGDAEFFLCGPAGFMQAIYDGLRALGVHDERIRTESFGPASLRRQGKDALAVHATAEPPAAQSSVTFSLSEITALWTSDQGSLLDFAQGLGLDPPFACREGQCGSCVTALTQGKVSYLRPPAWPLDQGEVLLCCAVPAASGQGRLVLNL